MDYLSVNGGMPLNGSIGIHGAKNAALPVLTACTLIKGEAVIHNCPELSDVSNTVKILRFLGARVKREGSTVTVNASGINRNYVPEEYMREMRSSIIFLGAICARTGCACMCLPGGCNIGLRPIDLHLKGLAELSGVISFDGEKICCDMTKAVPSKLILSFPSVGATENLILASVLLNGTTTIINAAREPEISDLCEFLNKAGAKISGASTSIIKIEGVKSLHSAEHTVIPDRILASTFMAAAAATKGSAELKRICLPHLKPVMEAFADCGCEMRLGKDSLYIKTPHTLRHIKNITTKPYPGFPTDSQAPITAMLSLARGTSTVTETVFENRFRHINELCRFGADIKVNDRTAIIKGVKELYPSHASCTDLRGGAAVLIAALAAKGSSEIDNIYHLDRGYENIEYQLSLLGADIKRIKDEKKYEVKTE